ncbi:MAG: MATE family efflux transporter, partial [Anaerolineaceae bacterium]|nr:MATE family efflux transporter [Anaerolineaceae bacterium]
MRKINSHAITNDPIPKVLLQLFIPVYIAQLSFVVFNLFDAYFISQLGTDELAAVLFSGTLIFFVQVMLTGLGNGSAVIIAHSLGAGDHQAVRKLMTICFILIYIVALIVCITILLMSKSIFVWMGVEPELMPMTLQYIRIWMIGVPFWLVPMLGNNAIRASGDSKTASFFTIMMILTNAVLDPLLITGWGPFPKLGLPGAALTNVLSRIVVAFAMGYMLIFRYKMLSLKLPEWKGMWKVWKQVLKIGLPISATKSIMPISMGYITSLVALSGAEAVAASAIVGKMQPIAMSMAQAIMMIIPGFVGQNIGAGNIDRARKGVRLIEGFVFVFQLFMWGLLLLIGPSIIGIYTTDPLVRDYSILWLGIVPPVFGFLSWILIGTTTLNTLKRS